MWKHAAIAMWKYAARLPRYSYVKERGHSHVEACGSSATI